MVDGGQKGLVPHLLGESGLEVTGSWFWCVGAAARARVHVTLVRVLMVRVSGWSIVGLGIALGSLCVPFGLGT